MRKNKRHAHTFDSPVYVQLELEKQPRGTNGRGTTSFLLPATASRLRTSISAVTYLQCWTSFEPSLMLRERKTTLRGISCAMQLSQDLTKKICSKNRTDILGESHWSYVHSFRFGLKEHTATILRRPGSRGSIAQGSSAPQPPSTPAQWRSSYQEAMNHSVNTRNSIAETEMVKPKNPLNSLKKFGEEPAFV